MKITITKNTEEFDRIAAWRIITQMLIKSNSVIGLSTGETTINMHGIVSAIYSQFPFDVSEITIFNVDEIVNLSRESASSCYYRILNQIVIPLGIKESNFIMPPAFSDNFFKECRLFEKQLEKRGGVDLQILGIGCNGHIGINQPGTPFESTTWISPLDNELEKRLRDENKLDNNVDIKGLTLGIRNIMNSRKIILAAKGKHKAEIIEKAVLGPVITDIPASVLQLHPDCEILLDAEAGRNIKDRL